MTITKHELRQGRTSFWIWTASIGFLLAVCVFLFPEIKGEMDGFGEVFASMGSFTEAFGMDRLNFGTLIGFYSIECGNVLGLGGAFFASLCAVAMLSKEERGRTAEFLLAHPVSRARIVTEKLLAVLIQITAMNLLLYALSLASIAVIGEEIPWKELNLLHLAFWLMQHLLRRLRVYAQRKRGGGDGHCRDDVFSEYHCEYLGICGIFKVHHPVRVLRRRGHHRERQPERRHACGGIRPLRRGDNCCLWEISEEGYSLNISVP